MIFIADSDLILGLKFCGAKGIYEDIDNQIKQIPQEELIVTTEKYYEKLSKRFSNIAIIPNNIEKLSDISDLKKMIRKTIGIEIV